MTNQQSSYRQIMKATSLFGGVQFFNILIAIIRSKFIAVLLGPVGMGIEGLFMTATGMIAGLTNFGLATSAVRDVSTAYESGKTKRISIVVTVFRRWVWITGILGAFVIIIFSPWLSQITFGNRNYTFSFIWLSITLLLNQISAGQGVVLRGMRQIKYMAKSAMLGSFFGLITAVPLFYYFGVKGIVPGIIITSVASLIFTWYFAHKIEIKPCYVSKARTIAEGKLMLKMGFMISLSGLITLGASYIVRIFIGATGGIDQVGLYTAGFSIINGYVGMIFTAMSADYYPRLAAVANSNEKSKLAINQQAEIALLIIAPIIIIFLIFINWLIILLYSTKFLSVNDMLLWAALGMLFKATSWSIAFIFLAKGASKLFFMNELIANIYLLALNLLGYKLFGLTGLGISFLTAYILYCIQVFTIAHIKFEFTLTNEFFKVFGVQLLLSLICFVIVKNLVSPYSYILGALILLASIIHSFKELDKRLGLKSIYISIRNRF